VHIVDDDLLHTDPHVVDAINDEQQHDGGDQRRSENLHDRGMTAPEQRDDNENQCDGEWHFRNRCYALMPELSGSGTRGA
jgi:hypothetical protein